VPDKSKEYRIAVHFSRISGPLLTTGIALASYVLLSRPLADVFLRIGQVDERFDLQAAPAVVVISLVFGFYQFYRRRELSLEAQDASQASRDASIRADEMARLVSFGHALTRFPDFDSVRAAAGSHIPMLLPNRRVWVMTRAKGQWEPLVNVGETSAPDRERAARHAVGEGGLQLGTPGEDVCFPMVIADTPVCVLGVAADPPLTEHQRSVLSTCVALLAGALKNAELFQEVHENSLQDGLTGCFNRTHAIESLDTELRRSRRSKRPFSVLMFDIDTFKSINDRFGHLCGDAVLAAIGTRMRAALRSSDVKCRYGGDEFLVILPETPITGARQVCETLRRAIEKEPIAWADGIVSATASFGVTEISPGEIDPLAIVARTDAALYRSKQEGRNRVSETQSELITA
jgi:diguanylate cyclase (GGDEF)-like protein